MREAQIDERLGRLGLLAGTLDRPQKARLGLLRVGRLGAAPAGGASNLCLESLSIDEEQKGLVTDEPAPRGELPELRPR